MPRNIYQSYKQTLAAGELASFNVYGSFLSVLTWADTTDPSIIINRGQEMKIKAGMSIKIIPDQNANMAAINANDATPGQGIDIMSFVQFRNNGASPVVLEFATSDGEIRDQRFTTQGSLQVIDVAASASLNAGKQTTNTTAALANNTAGRVYCMIQSDPANTDKIYIGGSGVTSAGVNAGAQLSPGQSIVIDKFSGQIYTVAASGTQTFYLMAPA